MISVCPMGPARPPHARALCVTRSMFVDTAPVRSLTDSVGLPHCCMRRCPDCDPHCTDCPWELSLTGTLPSHSTRTIAPCPPGRDGTCITFNVTCVCAACHSLRVPLQRCSGQCWQMLRGSTHQNTDAPVHHIQCNVRVCRLSQLAAQVQRSRSEKG